jgi:translocation and assembly module TamA
MMEYYQSSPREGYRVLLNTAHMKKDLLASTSAHQMRLSFQELWNFGHMDPPLWVLGLRGGLMTTTGDEGSGLVNVLPVQYRYHLGGMASLRGFARDELPRNEGGALTAAFLGTEVRSTSVLPRNFEPYIFTDLGMVGDAPVTLDQTLYYSPGLGLRWASPIGVFRLNVAHGFIANATGPVPPNLSHWQFYLSYGEEF